MAPPLALGNVLRTTVTQGYCSSLRHAHFLSAIPMRKRGVEGDLPKEYFENKTVVLYFSAGWCGSCKFLTPKLKKFYDAIQKSEEGSNLEIVWVSKDKEADHQLEYYEKNLPAWPYIPFGDPNIQKLGEKYKAVVIPVLKLIDSNGEVAHDRVRADVEAGIKADPVKVFEQWKTILGQK